MPGNCRIEVEAESYRAQCEFALHRGDLDWWSSCKGDQLGLLSTSENVVGILVPARLPAIRVRVLRDRAPIFDRLVSQSSSCPPSGLCIYMDDTSEMDSDSEGLQQSESWK
jgi:hypothetical protein